MPCGQKRKPKQAKQQEQYCNTFSKDFKNSTHKKKKIFKKKISDE